jgi:hypothetical protein
MLVEEEIQLSNGRKGFVPKNKIGEMHRGSMRDPPH